MKPFKRIYDGDLRQKYEDEVIHNDDNGHIMGIKNVMCGAIDIGCLFEALHYWNYDSSEDECREMCGDQQWDVGFSEWYSPCEGRDYEDDHWEDDHWEDDHWEDDDEDHEVDFNDIWADDVCLIFIKFILNRR